jgi:hypothetical protein
MLVTKLSRYTVAEQGWSKQVVSANCIENFGQHCGIKLISV